jgi:DNA repair protein RecN (Recombination protein N)
MLQQIVIRHFALIEELTIDFHSGSTMITGETGAGKSIILSAIELALGGRATQQIVTPNKKTAEIVLTFDIENLPRVKEWLEEHDLEDEEHCLLRRVITEQGKSRSYINSIPVTTQNLKQLSLLLVNIHGQHDNHLLLKMNEQLRLLDAYAQNEPLLSKLSNTARSWKKTKNEYEKSKETLQTSQQRADYLQFQLTEFNELGLTTEQVQTLPAEHKRLANSEALIQDYRQALSLLSSDSNSKPILEKLNQLNQMVSNLSKQDHRVASNQELLGNALIQLEELNTSLQGLLDTTDIDPRHLANLEQQLTLLHNMSRKHHVSIENLPGYFKKIEAELSNLSNLDGDLAALEETLLALEIDYTKHAKQLTERRKKAASKLNQSITQLIQTLGMPKASFEIKLITQDDTTPHLHGNEQADFQIQTNPGLAQQALSKIASGGELSRISLAIQVIMAKQVKHPTLFFDEVDVGIGGVTAATVGALLRQLGSSHQVITITHQPQVAASAAEHLAVYKTTDKNSTQVNIVKLNKTKRIDELARMLGGIKITKQTKAHAEEMLELHQVD